MKCTIPEISWHNRDPVLSLDIQLKTDKEFYRLASGGTDSHVIIWHMVFNQSEINLDLAADLTRHQRAVNVVKWSPNGQYLASGDDESIIFIWKMKEDSEVLNIYDNLNENDKECWICLKVLRGHIEDVYDISWCPRSLYIASGSIDNTVIIWDINKGKSVGLLDNHKGFVQGVSWDPKNQYVATLCTDRYLRIFDIQTKKVVVRINKCSLLHPENKGSDEKMEAIFHDDTLQTFFRRLSFSPDGNLLITPAGVIECNTESKKMHSTYIFSRFSLKQPSIILPSPDEYTIVVRFCPLFFKLQEHSTSNIPIISLPYRMVFAIATKNSVYLYDTQQKIPFGSVSNIHYTRLTDMSWSNDGKILAVSSTDGFCSLLTFSEGELGEVYSGEIETSENCLIARNNNTNVEITSDTPSKQKVFNTKSQHTGTEECNSIFSNLTSNSHAELVTVGKAIIQLDTTNSTTFAPKSNETGGISISTSQHPIISGKEVKLQLFGQDVEHLNKNKDTRAIGEATVGSCTQNCNDIIDDKQNNLFQSDNPVHQSELSEDIRLFYEDSQDEKMKSRNDIQIKVNDKGKHSPEQCKIPRRVQLTTISTPRSKK